MLRNSFGLICQTHLFRKRIVQIALAVLIFYLLVDHLVVYKTESKNRDKTLDEWELPFPVLSTKPVESTGQAKSLLTFEQVQVIVKTGTAELESKLPTYLRTVVSEVPESSLLIFSDAATTVQSYVVRDVLEDLPDSYIAQNSDFDAYRTQKESLKAGGQNFTDYDSGWRLDKYKFIPMVSKTWQLQPNKDFYVFIELDTFVFWDTVMAFLATLDPSEALHMGATIGNNHFPYGGAGTVISRGGMKKLFAHESDYGAPGTHQFGLNAKEECCGDSLLADAFHKVGVWARGYWPMFSGDPPSMIAFGGPNGYWCEPLATLHHVQPEEIDSLWKWVQSRSDPPGPYRYKDFFNYAMPKILVHDNKYWNYGVLYAEHVHRINDADNFEKCKASCQEQSGCFRFQSSEQLCEISFSMQIGRSIAKNDLHASYHAEANLTRIQEFLANSFCPELIFKSRFDSNRTRFGAFWCKMIGSCVMT